MAENIEEIIGTLYDMVQDAWSLPLSGDKCVLEREKILDALDEISNNLPDEFKKAKSIVEARNEIIADAKSEAENLLKQAEQKARQMISDEEVYKQAQNEADEMINGANAKAEKIIADANAKAKALKTASINYVLESLKQSEETITSALKDVSSARSKMESVLGSDPAAIEEAKQKNQEEMSDMADTKE